LGVPIFPAVLQDLVPSNALVAFLTDQLGSVRNGMFGILRPISELPTSFLEHKAARQTQAGIAAKVLQEFLEVVRVD
jgi:hypothetical protein